MATTTTAVFNAGPHPVSKPKHLKPGKAPSPYDRRVVPGLPRRVMVVTPTDAGKYPVVVFLHGFLLGNSCYEELLAHVASHGFIVVAPQLGIAIGFDDYDDIKATCEVAAWFADEQHGLSYVLHSVFKLDETVKPDLSRLAVAGHSRGGDTAFAVALGLGIPMTMPQPKFSALIGVDPVAGGLLGLQLEPKVLTFQPNSLNTGMPVLVLGTEHGGPWAPKGVSHEEFYRECCVPPNNKYHIVVKNFGHMCMVDDNLISDLLLGANDNARRTVGGVMVAFLRAKLQDQDEDLNVVLANPPGLAPADLDPVEHN